jgi:ubiquinone/menaquinone biosynthesis C-methylase UbiE
VNAQTSTGPPPASDPLPGGHDWHSPQYVRTWVEGKEAQAAARTAQFDLLADCIPHPREAAITILDVGAGWGPLTRRLLELFPAARATLLDYSEAMVAEARVRLQPDADRVQYVVCDLAEPGALDAVPAAGRPFDAIVSACCFHNIDPAERIWALYREIRATLAPGGCFLNLDAVGTDEPIIRNVTRRRRVEQERRRRLAEDGLLPSFAAIDAELATHRRGQYEGSHGPRPERRSLADHLGWLQEAGFDAVECFWREGSSALLGGYVAAASDPTS